jgi:hypothetical protein
MNAHSTLLSIGLAVVAQTSSLAQSQSPTSFATPPPPLQQLTVVCIRYSPGEQPLQVTDRFSALSSEDIALLRRCVPHGSAEVHGRGIYEDGPKAKAILLLTGPFQHQVIVAQPWHSCAVYLQDGQSLTILPKDAALWSKCIYLEQQSDAPRYTTYSVDLTTGGRMGGSAGAWKQ